MSLGRTFYCDQEDCGASWGANAGSTQAACPGLLTVTQSGRGRATHFCSWDCLMKYAAKIPAPEIISFGTQDDADGSAA